MTHLDSFSGSTADLTKKEKGDPVSVLRCLDSRVSTFEIDAVLGGTLTRLETNGYIISVESAYPWHAYEITEKGREKLEASND